MDDVSWIKIWQDRSLRYAINRLAYSNFSTYEDIEDARQEAYAWICRLEPNKPLAYYVEAARSAIRSFRRAYRRQSGLPPDDD